VNGMRERMVRLERDATAMGTPNHGRFLSEAMQALRDPAGAGDVEVDEIEAPLRALRLLDVLWDSSYANRPEPKAALNDVGAWLERRLLHAPGMKAEELLVELGWLKRLARHHEALRREAVGFGGRGPAVKPTTKVFGKRIAELERRRRAELSVKMAPVRGVEAERERREADAKVAAAPVVLPEEVAVTFTDFGKARDARVAAAARVKKKREPKEALLDLMAVGGALPGTRLICSTTQTSGMGEVFERVRMTPGAMDWVAYAAGLERRADGTVFVGRLSLSVGRKREG
jgi:hypothetical protein